MQTQRHQVVWISGRQICRLMTKLDTPSKITAMQNELTEKIPSWARIASVERFVHIKTEL